MKNKYKNIIIILIIFLLAFIFYFINEELNKNKKSDINTSLNTFSKLKETCNLFLGLEDVNVYKNKETGFSFKYPKNTIVCERVFSSGDLVRTPIEITLWNKSDFLSETAQKGSPPIIIDINNKNADALSSLKIVVSEKEKFINGKKIVAKEVKNKTCIDNCPVFKIYDFWDNENHFVISEKKDSDYSIIDSVKLNKVKEK